MCIFILLIYVHISCVLQIAWSDETPRWLLSYRRISEASKNIRCTRLTWNLRIHPWKRKNHRANHHLQVLYGSFNWIMNQIFTNWKWLKNHHVHPFSKDWLASFQVLTEHKSLIWPTEAACYIFHMPPEWSEVWLIQGCGGMDGWSEASKNATTFSRARCRCYIVLGRFIYAILWYLPRGWRTFPLNDDGIHFGKLTYPIENGPFEDVFPIINGGYSSQLCQFAGG